MDSSGDKPRVYVDGDGNQYLMDIGVTFGSDGEQWCSHENTTLVWHTNTFNEFDHVVIQDDESSYYIFGNPDFEKELFNNGFPTLNVLFPTEDTMERYAKYLNSIINVLEHEIYREIE